MIPIAVREDGATILHLYASELVPAFWDVPAGYELVFPAGYRLGHVRIDLVNPNVVEMTLSRG